MIILIVVFLGLALACISVMRHFFIQLTAIKLLFDCSILLLVSARGLESPDSSAQAVGWILGSIECLAFFIILSCGAKRFNGTSNLYLENLDD